ncbi:MAG: polysaccharide deacetylase family protein, partial [Gemmatimonadales bacterium]
DWFAQGQVKVVTIPELLALPEECDAVALTFDDALASVATEAAPRLAAHGFPATVFVATDHVGRDNCWGGKADATVPTAAILGWEALATLAHNGWSVGSHSRTHPHLTQCSDAELADEIIGSAEAITSHLGTRPTTFAYPFGDTDARVAAATAAVYREACTTEYLPLDVDSTTTLLPRLDAWYFRGSAPFRDWGSRRFRRGLAWRHALRRVRRMLP